MLGTLFGSSMSYRGESQVIGAMLLMVITVAMWTTVWLWFYPMYLGWLQNLERRLMESRLAYSEKLIVERINYTASGINIFITNVGRVEVYLGSIYVNDSLVWNGEARIKSGESKEFTVGAPHAELYVIKICSIRGRCWEVVDYAEP